MSGIFKWCQRVKGLVFTPRERGDRRTLFLWFKSMVKRSTTTVTSYQFLHLRPRTSGPKLQVEVIHVYAQDTFKEIDKIPSETDKNFILIFIRDLVFY